jgi:tetratricopeptide (TPR) repeat protein
MMPGEEREKGRKGEGEKSNADSPSLPFSPSPLLPFSPSPPVRQRWRWTLFVVATLLLAVGTTGAWHLFRRPTPIIPPMPKDIPDSEVLGAIERARKKVLDEPSNGNAWGNLGMVLMAHSFLAEADTCFAEAARLSPSSPSWPYGRALIALKRDPAAAPPFLRQALMTAGSTWPEYQSAARLQLAEIHLEQQELDEAERLFREELRHQPNNARVAFGLGLIALARDDEPTAEKFLTAARSNSFARKRATAQLAALARMRGDLTAATNHDREIAALPDDPPWPDPFREEIDRKRVGPYAWIQQEDQLEQQHRFREAAEVYLKEIKEKPTARAYARAGFNLAQAGEFDQGLKYLRQAVQFEPDNAHAHYLLAVTLCVRAEAESKQSPDSVQAKEWFRESVEHARRTTELRPTQAAAFLYWGLALKQLGEPAAAIAPLRLGVECLPSDFRLQLTLGEVLLETKQFQEAEVHLKNARNLNPNDPRPDQALERLRRTLP